MRVRVDPRRCQGHGRCYVLAPSLFEHDDVGDGHEIGAGVVPPELVDEAHLAASNCPEQAVTVDETP